MGNQFVKVKSETEAEIKKIINTACRELNLNIDCVVEKDGTQDCAEARYIIVKIIRERFGKEVPYLYIGRMFKRDNHLFAFQAELRCKELMQVNKDFKNKYLKVVSA